jgi:hypothetical protein
LKRGGGGSRQQQNAGRRKTHTYTDAALRTSHFFSQSPPSSSLPPILPSLFPPHTTSSPPTRLYWYSSIFHGAHSQILFFAPVLQRNDVNFCLPPEKKKREDRTSHPFHFLGCVFFLFLSLARARLLFSIFHPHPIELLNMTCTTCHSPSTNPTSL